MHTELVWAWARPIVTMSSLTTGAGHWPQLDSLYSRPGDTALCTTCSSQDSINRPVLPCKASYAHWSASSVMIGREGGMMTASTHSVSVPWHEAGQMIHIMTWLLVMKICLSSGCILWQPRERTNKRMNFKNAESNSLPLCLMTIFLWCTFIL